MTHAADLTIRRNPYSGKTNPSEFSNHLEQANQIFKQVSAQGRAKYAPRKCAI